MNQDDEDKVMEVVMIGLALFILTMLLLLGIAFIVMAFLKVY